jgi:hypothetical protein
LKNLIKALAKLEEAEALNTLDTILVNLRPLAAKHKINIDDPALKKELHAILIRKLRKRRAEREKALRGILDTKLQVRLLHKNVGGGK